MKREKNKKSFLLNYLWNIFAQIEKILEVEILKFYENTKLERLKIKKIFESFNDTKLIIIMKNPYLI